MSMESRIIEEINEVLNRLAAQGEPWRAQFVAAEIVQAHEQGLNADSEHADFHKHTSYSYTRDQVRRCMNRRAGDDAAPKPAQLSLPGFEREHLQDYYIVRRNGEDIGVSILDMTEMEIKRKAKHYRSMADACVQHARELERFLEWRRERVKAAS